MKKIRNIIVSMLFVASSFGQSVGSDATFDIVTWNLKEFPLSGNTISKTVEIINAINVDVIVLQEIENLASFNQLLSSLSGWNGYRANSASYDINLAFIYKTDEIIINNHYEIYGQDWYAFPRSPLVIDLTWSGIDFLLINNHFKCCSGSENEDRRLQASQTLKTWIDNNHSDENVILLGDLNDDITESSSTNVFWGFIEDSPNYQFTDMAIGQGSSSDWSYPSWPSHLDHILITDELFDEFAAENSFVQTIHAENYVSYYSSQVSDHRPVVLCLEFSSSPTLAGDINFDGILNILDVVILVNCALGTYQPTAEELIAGDMDENETLDILDIVQLVNQVLEG